MSFRPWPGLTRRLSDKIMGLGLRRGGDAETELEEDLGEAGGHLPNAELADALAELESAIEHEREVRQHRDDQAEPR